MAPARAVATVVAAERTSGAISLEGAASGVHHRWRVRLQFTTADGAAADVETTFLFGSSEEPYVGAVLPIVYDPARPERVELDESEEGTISQITAMAGPTEVAGMPLDEYLRLAQQDPAALQARAAEWTQAQMAAAEAQMAAAQQEAAAQLAAAQGAEAPATDLAGQLARLGELHAAGTLSDEEFAAAKQRLLGG